jgi:hypothetical protein
MEGREISGDLSSSSTKWSFKYIEVHDYEVDVWEETKE